MVYCKVLTKIVLTILHHLLPQSCQSFEMMNHRQTLLQTLLQTQKKRKDRQT